MKFFSAIICFLIIVNSYSQSKYAKNFAFVNTKGEVVFDAKFKWVGEFSNGLAVVHKYTIMGSKAYWNRGFINTKGVQVIEALYEDAYNFKEDVTWAKKRGESAYILIDKNGKRVGNSSFEKVGYWFEGMCKVERNGKKGFVNTKGEVVIGFDEGYVDMSYFSEGLASVTKENTGYGFIDKTGKVVIPLKFKQAGTSSFQDGLARAKINGRTGLINKKGEVVVQAKYGTVSGFGDSLLTVGFGNAYNDFGFVDFNNNVVIKGQYDRASSFKGGYAEVSKNDLEGIINKKGEFVLPLKFESVYNKIDEGHFKTKLGSVWSYFDENGKEITQIEAYSRKYKERGAFSIYDRDSKTGQFYNTKGELLSNAKFCKVEQFSEEGLAKVLLCDGVNYQYGSLVVAEKPDLVKDDIIEPSEVSKKYTSTRFKTSFNVPVKPSISEKEDKTGATITAGGKQYSVVAVMTDLGKNVKKSKIMDLLIQACEKGSESIGAKVLAKEEITINGHQGLKYLLLKDGLKYSYISSVNGSIYYNWIFIAKEKDFHKSIGFEKSIKLL